MGCPNAKAVFFLRLPSSGSDSGTGGHLSLIEQIRQKQKKTLSFSEALVCGGKTCFYMFE